MVAAATAQTTQCAISTASPRTTIAALFRVMNRYVGNLPPMPGVFPDYPASVVPNAGDDRELAMM
jgi:hypothetical protein